MVMAIIRSQPDIYSSVIRSGISLIFDPVRILAENWPELDHKFWDFEFRFRRSGE
jgi:hypothetical protein